MMKIKIVFILALFLVVAAFFFAQYGAVIDTGYAKTVGTDCPDGHVCYWAVQKQTGNIMCRANTNDAWSWRDDPPQRCGNNDDKPKNTDVPSTLVVVIDTPVNDTVPKPTNTSAPPNTPKPDNDTRNNPTLTLTPTVLYGDGKIDNQVCNFCDIASTMAAAQSTIAAAVSDMVGGE